MRDEVRRIEELFERESYIADPAIATAVHLSMTLRKPLLVEGHAGVGKTEIAKVLAQALDTELIRLQCYEGLDASHALYEWNYTKQLLATEADGDQGVFTEEYLFERPLLRALRGKVHSGLWGGALPDPAWSGSRGHECRGENH